MTILLKHRSICQNTESAQAIPTLISAANYGKLPEHQSAWSAPTRNYLSQLLLPIDLFQKDSTFFQGKELFNTNWNTFLSTIALSQFHPAGFFMKSPPGHLARLVMTNRYLPGVTIQFFCSLVGVPSYILNSAIKYKGSLTSSPCTENVNWSVYPRIIFIRDTQVWHYVAYKWIFTTFLWVMKKAEAFRFFSPI